jgi:hypothetical protein
MTYPFENTTRWMEGTVDGSAEISLRKYCDRLSRAIWVSLEVRPLWWAVEVHLLTSGDTIWRCRENHRGERSMDTEPAIAAAKALLDSLRPELLEVRDADA